MPFDAHDRTRELLGTLAPLLARIATHDPDLAKQLRRAGASILQNISEANRRTGKDRRYLFRVALGSAAESAACLEVALAFGYLAAEDIAASAAEVRAKPLEETA